MSASGASDLPAILSLWPVDTRPGSQLVGSNHGILGVIGYVPKNPHG
jgi:hypothetical protein